MSDQILKAFCNKYGQIMLSIATPDGMFELTSAPGNVLAHTIDQIADMSEDECRYMVPGYLSAPDDKARTDCVLDFQVELIKKLSANLAAEDGGRKDVCAALTYK